MKSALSPHQIEQLAHRQLLDYQCNNPGTCFSEPGFNITVAAAYHLQDEVTVHIDEQPLVSCTIKSSCTP